MRTRRQFSAETKAKIVLEVLSGTKRQAAVCREYQIKDQLLSRWKREFVDQAAKVFERTAQRDEAQQRIADLERLVGRLTLELEVAKKASSSLSSTPARNGRSR